MRGANGFKEPLDGPIARPVRNPAHSWRTRGKSWEDQARELKILNRELCEELDRSNKIGKTLHDQALIDTENIRKLTAIREGSRTAIHEAGANARAARFMNEVLGAIVLRAIRAIKEPKDRIAILANLRNEYPEALADLDKTDLEALERGIF